ncbi:hypothetical protein HOP50_09g56750 [Chloropicon primus]|uniref:Uncharacterized protein n=1 Tax=Chloropicon primus TaxID=1764295 RepID=A0A5B8MU00_9CHLO|nr:hypothetical protein A3770_09p56530 [Chloropicon primus]UPR02349.1 hypothetical protein HOP50_09g56750 [Chloropicon primus]|eukprot:QDZ23135.1 hypothetical protein A3770_09p56530 [Chloropicon primus]
MTAEQEDLWDTRSLYSSQLSAEDLLWTDWFGGTEEDATFEEALLGKSSIGKKGGGLGSFTSMSTTEDEAAWSSDEMSKRVLQRTSKGKRRECVGANLFKDGCVSVALWCDPEATSREISKEFGRGKCNPTALYNAGSGGATGPKDYVLDHAGDLGLAVCATTTKPIAYREWKRSIIDALGGKKGGSAEAVLKEAFEKLEGSDVLYEGLFGIPLPRVLFHEPKHGTVDMEQTSGTGWKMPALVKAQDACIAAVRGVRKHLLRCQKEYVRVGAEFVFDFQKPDGGHESMIPREYDVFNLGRFASFGSVPQSLSSELLGQEDAVDLMVVAPPDKYGKRTSIQLGTFGMTNMGKPLLNASVFEASDESLLSHRNYPLLGLGYVSNGFSGIKWRQKLPRWRRALRRSGKKFRDRVNFLISKGGVRRDMLQGESKGDAAEPQHLDTLEVIHGECVAGMFYMTPNFESYDLRAGNPIPMLLHRLHTRTLAAGNRRQQRCVYQLQ